MTQISFSIPDWMIVVLAVLGFVHIGVDVWKTITERQLERRKKRLKE